VQEKIRIQNSPRGSTASTTPGPADVAMQSSRDITPRSSAGADSSISRDITPSLSKNKRSTPVLQLSKMPEASPSLVQEHETGPQQLGMESDADSYFPQLKRRRGQHLRREDPWNHVNFEDALGNSQSFSKSKIEAMNQEDMANNNNNSEQDTKMRNFDDLPLGAENGNHAFLQKLKETARRQGLKVSVKIHDEAPEEKKAPGMNPMVIVPKSENQKDGLVIVKERRVLAGCEPFKREGKNVRMSKSPRQNSMNEVSSASTTPLTSSTTPRYSSETYMAVDNSTAASATDEDPTQFPPPAHGDNSLREGWRHLKRPLHQTTESLLETRQKRMANTKRIPLGKKELLDELPPEHLAKAMGEALAESGKKDKIQWYTNLMRKDTRYCPFFSQTVPGISASSYMNRLRTHFSSTGNCHIAAMIYLDRLGAQAVNPHTIHRLSLTALVMATKFVESDCYYENAHYAKCGGVNKAEMNDLEATFLDLLGWDTFISEEDYVTYKRAFHC